MKRKFKFKNQRLKVQWNEAAEEPVEVMLYDTIGKDPWSGGGGMCASDFRSVLNEIPKGRNLHLRVNSKGGDVHEGMAIMSMLNEWPQEVTATVDGIAASTASWMILGADKVRAFKNSQMFIHDALSLVAGNAEELRKTADDLDKTSDQIACMYAEKTGKRPETMRRMMKEETLMTGEEAEEIGLVDEIIDGSSCRNFTPIELNKMKDQLKAFFNSVAKTASAKPNNTIMNREQMLAMLKEAGVAVSNEATDEQIQAALKNLLATKTNTAAKPVENSELAALRAQIEKLTESNDASKRLRITNEVDGLIANDQLPAGLRDKTIARAMKDEAYLEELQAMPAKPPGVAPVNVAKLDETKAAPSDIFKHVAECGSFANMFVGGKNSDRPTPVNLASEVIAKSAEAAVLVKKHKNIIDEYLSSRAPMAFYNTNSIDSNLQRTVILQELIRAYAIRIMPLDAFCTVFNNVPLEGTDTVQVPYFPLQTTASTDWNASNGYVFGNTTSQVRTVTVNKRKYQGMAFSSYELRRQPYLNLRQLAVMNAQKLAVDVFTDVVKSNITAANYGAAVKTALASAFTSADVADLYGSATGLQWPDAGRSLVLDHPYKVALLKDASFKQYLAYGNTDPLHRAMIQEAYGFENIYTVPNLSTSYSPTGENLVGWINHKSALLVATSPIMPSPAVRQLLVQYDVVVDPELGIALEYRQWGAPQLDQTQEVVEANYGSAKGVETALARIVSA